jgi:hypothetical protein
MWFELNVSLQIAQRKLGKAVPFSQIVIDYSERLRACIPVRSLASETRCLVFANMQSRDGYGKI